MSECRKVLECCEASERFEVSVCRKVFKRLELHFVIDSKLGKVFPYKTNGFRYLKLYCC